MRVTEEEYAVLARRGQAKLTHAKPPKQPTTETRRLGTEAEEQEALIRWARLHVRAYPPLELLCHIPNGGSRPLLEAKKLSRLGVLPGMPDLFLPYPARNYHSWFGEMKSASGRLSTAQSHVLSQLRIYGYYAGVFRGWDEARASLVWYLGGE